MRLSSTYSGGDPTLLRAFECQYPIWMAQKTASSPAPVFCIRQRIHRFAGLPRAWHEFPLSVAELYAVCSSSISFALALGTWRQTNSRVPVLHAASAALPAKPSSFSAAPPPPWPLANLAPALPRPIRQRRGRPPLIGKLPGRTRPSTEVYHCVRH